MLICIGELSCGSSWLINLIHICSQNYVLLQARTFTSQAFLSCRWCTPVKAGHHSTFCIFYILLVFLYYCFHVLYFPERTREWHSSFHCTLNNDRKDVILILIQHKKRNVTETWSCFFEERRDTPPKCLTALKPLNANKDHDRTWVTDLFVFSWAPGYPEALVSALHSHTRHTRALNTQLEKNRCLYDGMHTLENALMGEIQC